MEDLSFMAALTNEIKRIMATNSSKPHLKDEFLKTGVYQFIMVFIFFRLWVIVFHANNDTHILPPLYASQFMPIHESSLKNKGFLIFIGQQSKV